MNNKKTAKAFTVLSGLLFSFLLAACQNPLLQLSHESSLYSAMGIGPSRMVKVKFVWPSEFSDYTVYDGRAVYEQEVELNGGSIDWDAVYAAYNDYIYSVKLGVFDISNPGFDIFHGMVYNYGYILSSNITIDSIVECWYNFNKPGERKIGSKPAINLSLMTVEEADGELEICLVPEFRQRKFSFYEFDNGPGPVLIETIEIPYSGSIDLYKDEFRAKFHAAYEKEYFVDSLAARMYVHSVSSTTVQIEDAFDPYFDYDWLTGLLNYYVKFFGDLSFYPEFK